MFKKKSNLFNLPKHECITDAMRIYMRFYVCYSICCLSVNFMNNLFSVTFEPFRFNILSKKIILHTHFLLNLESSK